MIRRILLIILGVILFAIIVGSATTYTLADNGRFLPGERWFDAQWSAEQIWLIRLRPTNGQRAESALSLLSRRLDNLEACQAQSCAQPALNFLNFAVSQAITAVNNAPEDQRPALRQDLYTLTRRALALLDSVDVATQDMGAQSETDITPARLAARLETLLAALEDPAQRIVAIAQLDEEGATAVSARPANQPTGSNQSGSSLSRLVDPRAVPFPDGAVDHSFFPLTGGHDNLECTACHTSGDYQGTSPSCVNCHAKDEPHEGQYGTTCTNCHVIESWKLINFDHSLVRGQDCAACHNPPANHFQGACIACHTDTNDFRNAVFNHTTIGSTDCAACHNPPENHFQGACKACHTDTSNFRNAVFNHTTIGSTDCAACHNPPANHFQGACRDCHTDTGNFRNANFNHSTIGGTDCSACHAPPANHFQGACRDCHTDTGNFRNANFNHSTIGGTDCSACHAPPANHFQGACRDCHTDTGNFRNVTFNHAGLNDCQSCHARPSNHFQGQCSDCHNTNSWDGASFNHTFPVNHEGANGDCATCHPGGNTATYTCTACHSQQKMDEEHDDEPGYTGNNCVQCHPDGREHDD